ncbi:MAG: NAD(P)-binding domain-containing protein, partial [Actinomycetota bacterium]|nr:NAD(P)-binding domain-containing protein [Actinomycetota bacterium]
MQADRDSKGPYSGRPKVGIVGTGAMGRPVADRLVSAGFEVAAYVRSEAARPSLAKAGVELVEEVPALGRG